MSTSDSHIFHCNYDAVRTAAVPEQRLMAWTLLCLSDREGIVANMYGFGGDSDFCVSPFKIIELYLHLQLRFHLRVDAFWSDGFAGFTLY